MLLSRRALTLAIELLLRDARQKGCGISWMQIGVRATDT